MPDNKKEEQKDKFIQTAKEHGCDEDEKKFSEKLKKMTSKRPPDSETE